MRSPESDAVPISQAKQDALEQVTTLIAKRWGGGAIQKLGVVPPRDNIAIPTGFAHLDEALGVGGLPRGRITEICGHRSSGKVTLTIHAIVQAQREGGVAAYFDVAHLLDPHYFVTHGVDLDCLLIVQPLNGIEALEIADTLVRSGGLDLIVFDSVSDLGIAGRQRSLSRARLLSAALRRLSGAIADSPTAFIVLNRASQGLRCTTGGRALRFYASIRLLVERQAWLTEGEDVVGCRSTVSVLKNKLAPPFRSADIEVRYEDSLRSN
jgi:recombination protein RecA